MAYLGNAPARSFISFERQVFTIVNSQTAYTLDHSVNNENDIRLVINNIVQEPGSGKAYTASGTTLTLSAALTNGTDEMYCVFLGRAVATNAPGAGSVGTSQLASDAVTEAKIADSAVENEHLNVNVITGQTAETSIATDDTILIHDTSASALRKMTRANFVSGVGGVNTPAFHARVDSANSTTDTTETKVTFGTEVFDVGSCYDTSTSRFTVPSGEAGKYFIYSRIRVDSATDSEIYDLLIKKNGSTVFQHSANQYRYTSAYVSGILDLSASDYLEVYVLIQNNLSLRNDQRECFFGGYKIIE